ncbi:hypothetical protein HX870_24465 [Pseudomonas gingeri]|uniref:ParB/Srx family N-terminal domain-containing protein n=1 Tax=Pseudomonas gingeri TaxID=117681 RepID=UPI0015A0D295|nr:ParB/Srx family N-terminal domain-containing protein [Pseudomonas gingeri]NWD70757.1 hypothetical protein [Pseudomonas gingeri]
MGYETWATDTVSPGSIDLDPRNPRLPSLPQNATQAQVLEELFNTSKVREMVRSVARSGFYPDQRVVVIRKDSGRGFIVIEGNRRVAACKVLIEPDLAPDKHSRVVRKWAVNADPYKQSFIKIPVVVAPSRLAAMQLLASRHLNSAPVIRWSRYAQGRFAINAFTDGQDISEVMDETGLSESELRQSIQEARMFELFLGLSWSAEEKNIIEDNLEEFPIEALRRILRSSATQEEFGNVTFDQEGWISFGWKKDMIEPLLKRFLYDAFLPLSGQKKAELNSRTLNDTEGVKAYLAKLPVEIKPSPVEEKTSAKEIIPEPQQPVGAFPLPKVTPKKKPGPKPRKTRLTALPTDIEVDLKNDKALALLDELQTIIPEDLACATGLLLRSLLEIALIARIKKVGRWADCMSKYGSERHPIPTLDQLLKFAGDCEFTISDLNLRKSLTNQGTVPRLLLNLVAHNDQHIFGQVEARDSANKLTPLLRALLGSGNS